MIVCAVRKESTAECSGIQSGDIIHYVCGLKHDMNKFTLTKVKNTDHITTACSDLKKSPAIGLILIIERTSSSVV